MLLLILSGVAIVGTLGFCSPWRLDATASFLIYKAFLFLYLKPVRKCSSSVQLPTTVLAPMAEAIFVYLVLCSLPQAHGVWGLRRVRTECSWLTALETSAAPHLHLLLTPFLPTIQALILSLVPPARLLTFPW